MEAKDQYFVTTTEPKTHKTLVIDKLFNDTEEAEDWLGVHTGLINPGAEFRTIKLTPVKNDKFNTEKVWKIILDEVKQKGNTIIDAKRIEDKIKQINVWYFAQEDEVASSITIVNKLFFSEESIEKWAEAYLTEKDSFDVYFGTDLYSRTVEQAKTRFKKSYIGDAIHSYNTVVVVNSDDIVKKARKSFH